MKTKITAVFLIIVTVAACLSVLVPKKTEAFLGFGDLVYDPTNYVENVLQYVEETLLYMEEQAHTVTLDSLDVTEETSLTTDISNFAETVARWLTEDNNKLLRDTVAKRLMDYIVSETTKWIQGGGSPMFIGDWNQFAHNAFSIAAGTVVEQTLPFLCSPFKLQVQLALQPAPYYQQITCTLDKVVSNIQDFYNNFQNGGWIAYNTMWQPQNNFYGVTLMAYDQIMVQGLAAKQAAVNEGLAGSGFLGQKQCKGGGKTSADLADLEAGGTDISKYQKDFKGNYCPAGQLQNVTPGAVIGYSAANMIGADSTWSASIQSWLSALVNALINRLFQQGMSFVATSGNDVYKPDINDVASSTTNGDKKQMINEVKPLISEWQYILKDKNQSLAYASSTKGVLQKIQSLNCQVAVNNSSMQDVQAAVSKLTSDISTTASDINDLQTKLAYPANYQLGYSSVIADISNLTGDVSDLQAKLKKANINITQGIQTDISALTNAINDLNVKITATTISDVQAVQSDISVLTSTTGDLQTKISAAGVISLQGIVADINRLTGEISALNSKVAEANSVIDKINKADLTDSSQVTSITKTWRDFIDKYQTTDQELAITSGSDRKAADKEVSNESDTLTASQKSLATCQGH